MSAPDEDGEEAASDDAEALDDVDVAGVFALPVVAGLAEMARRLAEQQASILKNLDLSWIPKVQVQTAQLANVVFPALEGIHLRIRGLLDALAPSFSGLKLPLPNWRGVKFPDNFDDIETMLLDEGLPLAWVPPAAVLQQLFDAPDAPARRRIIGRKWQMLSAACREQLESVKDPKAAKSARFALSAVAALEEGHSEASQALASNLLDSLVRSAFPTERTPQVTSQKTRLDIGRMTFQDAIVLGGVWGAYREYWPHKGDPIPRVFSRHASAHAVGSQQFSRVNAVIALMHVTAFIKALDEGDTFS